MLLGNNYRKEKKLYLNLLYISVGDGDVPYHLKLSSKREHVHVLHIFLVILFFLFFVEPEHYFSDDEIRENPSEYVNTVLYMLPRLPLINDGYAVQSTSYALLAHINHFGATTSSDSTSGLIKEQRDSMMKWLQTMRNTFGAFASTQVPTFLYKKYVFNIKRSLFFKLSNFNIYTWYSRNYTGRTCDCIIILKDSSNL